MKNTNRAFIINVMELLWPDYNKIYFVSLSLSQNKYMSASKGVIPRLTLIDVKQRVFDLLSHTANVLSAESTDECLRTKS